MKKTDKYLALGRVEPMLFSQDEVQKIISAASSNDRRRWPVMRAASILVILSCSAALLFFYFNFDSGTPQTTAMTNLSGDSDEKKPLLSYSNYYEYRFQELLNALEDLRNEDSPRVIYANYKNVPKQLTARIMLPEGILAELGITLTEDAVIFDGNSDTGGYLHVEARKRHSLSVSDNHMKGVKNYSFFPIYISDANGRQGVGYTFDSDGVDKWNNFKNAIPLLIPIIVDVPRQSSQVVFWFSANDDLFDIIGEEFADNHKRMKKKSLLAEKEKLTRSREALKKEIHVYPNPAKDYFNLSFDSSNKPVEISLYYADGKVVSTLFPGIGKAASDDQLTFSLDQVKRGVYLVWIKLENGEEIIKRIVKSR